jgi:hypothetical protein
MSGWLMRVEGGLAASFKQPDGSSLAGTDWKIGIKRGDEIHTVLVRTYLAPDIDAKWKSDSEYQARTAMGYLNDILGKGWNPNEPRAHAITITNPAGALT